MDEKAEGAPVSITLTRYREPDWLVMETLESLACQRGVRGEVVFLDQDWRADFAEKVEALSTKSMLFVCKPCSERGICYARNEGIRLARYDYVLQVDADVLPEPDWAQSILRALISQNAAVAGSRILPKWRGQPPILAKSKVVLDQYSVLDWGCKVMRANRIVSAGFGLNKSIVSSEMYFDESFGRRNGVLFSGAESNFCKRISEKGGKIIYAGEAVVYHQIFPERLKWSWVLRRLYFAGAGRRQLGGSPSPSRKPGLWDWVLLPIILPPYALGFLSARRPVRR